jgi:hypothetical protein
LIAIGQRALSAAIIAGEISCEKAAPPKPALAVLTRRPKTVTVSQAQFESIGASLSVFRALAQVDSKSYRK